MNRYFLSSLAEKDIENVVDYLCEENLQSADDFIDALYDAFEKLAQHPEIGHIREDLTHHPVKFWTFKWHYLIIYKTIKPIEIVRVLSGFRDIANLI